MNTSKEVRKAMYQELRRQFPNADKQILKNLAYDSVREAVANLKDGQSNG